MVGIIETKSPDAHHRLAVLHRIHRGIGDLQLNHDIGPVVFDLGGHRIAVPTTDIIHDIKFYAVSLCRIHDFYRHIVAGRAFAADGETGAAIRIEPLQRRGINSVLRHPAKVGVNRLLVVGRKQCRRLAVAKICKTCLIARAELPHVRPAMDIIGKRDRRWRGTAAVMPPTVDGRAITGAGEPSLITHRHLANHITGRTGCQRGFADEQHRADAAQSG